MVLSIEIPPPKPNFSPHTRTRWVMAVLVLIMVVSVICTWRYGTVAMAVEWGSELVG